MRPCELQRRDEASITGFVHGPSFRFRLEPVHATGKHGEQIAAQKCAATLDRHDDSAAELAGAEKRAGGARSALLT